MGGLEQNDWTGEIFLTTKIERGIIKAIIKNQIEQYRGQVDGVLSELTKEEFWEMYREEKKKKGYGDEFLLFKEKYYQYYQQEINKILQWYDW